MAIGYVFRSAETVNVPGRVEILLEKSSRGKHKGLIVVQRSFLLTYLRRHAGEMLVKGTHRHKMPAAVLVAVRADIVADPEVVDHIAVVAEQRIIFVEEILRPVTTQFHASGVPRVGRH